MEVSALASVTLTKAPAGAAADRVKGSAVALPTPTATFVGTLMVGMLGTVTASAAAETFGATVVALMVAEPADPAEMGI